ncbi:Trypsin [Popillia japonica]|uniref:Trypsin n=1 Tax=Popillia japonica TaxID=7064 RepID=A0AAW1LX49_POPJA
MWYFTLLFVTSGVYTAQTTLSQFPYLVRIQCTDPKVICAGSLLNEETILTAGRCVANCPTENIVVIAGSEEYDLNFREEISKVTQLYDGRNSLSGDDIAIICLKSRLQYSERIQPISIASRRYPLGTQGVISGWGRALPNTLRYTKVKLVSNRYCKYFYPVPHEKKICTAESSTSAHMGNDGGPLVVENEVVGLILGKGSDYTPRLYVDVYLYRNFIKENMCNIPYNQNSAQHNTTLSTYQ